MFARCLAITALVVPAWATAWASPGEEAFDGAVFGGPTGTHTSSILSNPASLLRITPGWHLFLNSAVHLEQIAIDRETMNAAGVTAPGPRIRDRTFGAGGQIGAIFAWPGGMIAGAASLLPPDETLAGKDSLAYHSRGIRTRRIDWFALAGGYRYGRAIHLAFSATMSERRTKMTFWRDTALEAGRDPTRGVTSDCSGAPCGLENPLATEVWTIDVEPNFLDVSNLVLSAGLLIRMPGTTLFGLTYQRPWSLGAYELSGTARVTGAPRDGGRVSTGDATLFVDLPEVWRLGTRTAIGTGWEFVTELRWRRLADLGTYDVRTHGGNLADGGVPEYYPRARGLRNGIGFEVGFEQVDVGQTLLAGARIGADSGATAANTISATSPWGAELTAAIGAQLRLGSSWILQAGYRAGYQPPIDSSPSAFNPIDRLDCVDSGYDFDLPACATVRAGYGLPTAAGTYQRWNHAAWLGLRIEIR